MGTPQTTGRRARHQVEQTSCPACGIIVSKLASPQTRLLYIPLEHLSNYGGTSFKVRLQFLLAVGLRIRHEVTTRLRTPLRTAVAALVSQLKVGNFGESCTEQPTGLLEHLEIFKASRGLKGFGGGSSLSRSRATRSSDSNGLWMTSVSFLGRALPRYGRHSE